MPAKNRVAGRPGDIFGVRLSDGRIACGQILGEEEFGGFVPCAFFDFLLEKSSTENVVEGRVIAALCTGAIALLDGDWPIVENCEVCLAPEQWPNARCRQSGDWIGAKFYDAGIVEAFLEAYFGLAPWDGMHDPEYFQKLLFRSDRGPKNPIFSEVRD